MIVEMSYHQRRVVFRFEDRFDFQFDARPTYEAVMAHVTASLIGIQAALQSQAALRFTKAQNAPRPVNIDLIEYRIK